MVKHETPGKILVNDAATLVRILTLAPHELRPGTGTAR